MILLGTPQTIIGREYMERLYFLRQPTEIPPLKKGHKLVCDVIRVPGIDTANLTVVVQNEKDIKQLTDAYSRGIINQLVWYSAPDPGFITLLQAEQSEKNVSSSAFLTQSSAGVAEREESAQHFIGSSSRSGFFCDEKQTKIGNQTSDLHKKIAAFCTFVENFDADLERPSLDWTNSREIRALHAAQDLVSDLKAINSSSDAYAGQCQQAILKHHKDIQYAPHPIIKCINSILEWIADFFGTTPYAFRYHDTTKFYSDNLNDLDPILEAVTLSI